jgi:serine/threonine-protein kinase
VIASAQVTGADLIGQVVAGKYRIDSVIGEGGMGFVVVAHHIQLETKVAIKLLRPELANNGEAVARFSREARAAVRIVSQHVARVFDVGELESGAPYMVMEFLEGGDLSSIIQKRGPLPIGEAVDYVLQATEAIAEAHAAGIVHRDLKPANLFCARRPDGTPSIKVLDFGISKLTSSGPGALQHTKTTAIMGSPFYMSPEQMESTRGVDMRTDIWGLGVILYELVTGRTPFEGSALPEICLRVATQPPPSMRMLRPDIPPGLEQAILKCLEKDRDKRYATVGQLALGLRDFATSRGRPSVDTILRTLEPATGDLPHEASSISPAADGARTIEPLGRTQVPMQGGTGKTVAIVAAAAVVLVAGVVSLLAMRSPAASSSATLVQSAAAAPASPVPRVEEPIVPAPRPVASASAAAAAEPAPSPVAMAAPAKKLPTAAKPPAPKGRPNCDPNFYLDAQGEKHFKPECFR